MPLKKRAAKERRTLSRLDKMQLLMLSGCVTWDRAEWERMHELWKIHGERLIQENIENGSGPPLFLLEVDPERNHELMEQYRKRFA